MKRFVSLALTCAAVVGVGVGGLVGLSGCGGSEEVTKKVAVPKGNVTPEAGAPEFPKPVIPEKSTTKKGAKGAAKTK
jgi:hypothetical protein